MAFREIMTGGACNVQDSNQRNMNPLNKLFDNLSMGQQQQGNFLQIDQNLVQNQSNILQQENQFQQMNQEWYLSQQQYQQQMIQQKVFFDQQWQIEKQQQLQQQYIQQKLLKEQWKNEEINYEANKMVNQFEEQNKLDPKVEQEQILKAADTMVDIMRKDLSPRFKNSKFLKFLEDIQSQKIKIEGDQVVVNQNTMDSVFQNAQQEQFIQEKQFEDVFQQSEEEFMKQQAEFQELWQKEYQQYYDDQNLMQNEYQQAEDKYDFEKQNEYDDQDDLLNLAYQLISQGQPSKAILCIEAFLKQKDDSKAWHLLGRLHQENDDDKKAVQCLLKTYEKEQFNLDVLLSLGVSCTNNLDEQQAMGFLKQWIQNNPKYSKCPINDQVDVNSMIQLFQSALNISNQDPELYTALSVIHFIDRNYEGAVQCFKSALKLDPQNYSLWNKLGATLAHLGMPDQALDAYKKALDLKPNYVRVWVNLGIAYAYKQQYQEAASYYLNALSFNPQADHLWNYLQSTFMCMHRLDLSELTYKRDINLFKQEFKILEISELPKPEIDYQQAINNFLIPEKEWINQFSQQQ